MVHMPRVLSFGIPRSAVADETDVGLANVHQSRNLGVTFQLLKPQPTNLIDAVKAQRPCPPRIGKGFESSYRTLLASFDARPSWFKVLVHRKLSPHAKRISLSLPGER